MNVPDVLLSGNHAEIAKWRRYEAIRKTFKHRRDLLEKAVLSAEEKHFLQELERVGNNCPRTPGSGESGGGVMRDECDGHG
jgi:tRNA (guanine37-N1)-methyltransferase